MATNNVCFEFGNKMIVSSNVEDVKNWINSFPGLTCNLHTEKNIDCIINNEWQVWGYYNQNKSPLNKDGFRLSCLKTTGIGNDQINFFLTECKSVQEIIDERAAFAERVRIAKDNVKEISETIGTKLSDKLNKKSKSCVKLLNWSNLSFTLQIGQNGFWINDPSCPHYHYVEEYFTHFNGETLITDEGKNVIDILNRFINEN